MAEYDSDNDEVDKSGELLASARQRYSYCVDAYATNRNLQAEDLRFYAGSPDNGWQWPQGVKQSRDTDPNGARPCLTINRLPQHVKQVTNEERQNRPSIKVIPVDDKADIETAEILNGVIRHIENISDADVAYDTACENQVVCGEGYWRILTEYCNDTNFDQDIRVRRIRNSFRVNIDPDCSDPTGADAKFAFVDEVLTEEEFKSKYPDTQPVDWEFLGRDDQMMYWYLAGEKKVRIAEYFYCEYDKKTLYLWPDGSTSYELPADGNVLIQPVRSREVSVKRVKWCKLSGQEVLEENDWVGKYIPIVRVIGNEFEVDGDVIISGLVRNTKDAQRIYNYWCSQEVELLALAPKAPFIGAAGQFEGYEDKWQTANITNYAYLEYKPVVEGGVTLPPPQRVAPPMPSAGLLQAKVGAIEDLKATTAQYNASLGERSNETSGRAILARQHEGDTANYHYIDNLARAIRQTGRIIIDLIPKIYDTRRILRIIGEDGEPNQVPIDPNSEMSVNPVMRPDEQGRLQEIGKIYNPGIGTYDVQVVVGPSYTTKRQEAATAMSEIVKGNPQLWQVMGDLLVKNMDWPGSQEMAKRMRAILAPGVLETEGQKEISPESKAAVMQAQQAMQMVQQKAAELDEIETKLKDEASRTVAEKASLNEVKTKIEAEQRIFIAEGNRMKAEIKSMMTDLKCREMDIAQAAAQAGTVPQPSPENEQIKQMLEQLGQRLEMVMQVATMPRTQQSTIIENPDGSFTMTKKEVIDG